MKRLPELLAVLVMLLASCSSFEGVIVMPPVGTPQPAATAPTSGATAPAPAAERAPEAVSSRWTPSAIDTAAGVDYLDTVEQQVVLEVNKARTDPAVYAREYLVPLRALYQGMILQYPGEIGIQTKEGIAALEECIKVLSSTKPLGPLAPMRGLSQAAKVQAADQAKTGATGHTGSDGSTLPDRLDRFGTWSKSAGENIDYGNAAVRRIVISFLVDDGVPSRGHRTNILSADFSLIGVAVGTHPVYGHMCVLDFAGGYKDKGPS